MNILAYYKNKIKERLGLCSPSAQMAAIGRRAHAWVMTGLQASILDDIEEKRFGQYEPKTFVRVPEYQPLTDIVQEFKWAVIYHNDD